MTTARPWGLRSRSVAQRFALELLLDETVPVVALEGPAGTGKSLLAIAAGLDQSLNNAPSPVRHLPVPRTGGSRDRFLPGDLADKTLPHFASVFDAMCVD